MPALVSHLCGTSATRFDFFFQLLLCLRLRHPVYPPRKYRGFFFLSLSPLSYLLLECVLEKFGKAVDVFVSQQSESSERACACNTG